MEAIFPKAFVARWGLLRFATDKWVYLGSLWWNNINRSTSCIDESALCFINILLLQTQGGWLTLQVETVSAIENVNETTDN